MDYRFVTLDDVMSLIDAGVLANFTAVKNKEVVAEILTREKIDTILTRGGYETVCIDDDGFVYIETTNKNLKVGDYIVSNDIAGYDNSYIVPAAKFHQLYDAIDEINGIYKPKGICREVYRLPHDMNLRFTAPWGSEMKIRSGGVLIFEEIDKVYGINQEEFEATYSIIED